MRFMLYHAYAASLVGLLSLILPGLLWLVSPDDHGHPPNDPCTVTCSPNGAQGGQSGSGTCSTIQFEMLQSKAGDATANCSTCELCAQTVRMTVTCAVSCTEGCTYVWEVHNYDGLGGAQPGLSGSGTMDPGGDNMAVTQRLETGCNGPTAQFGISVAGSARTYSLSCPCTPQ